jgi:Fe-S cluster biogenesis protein NfuA
MSLDYRGKAELPFAYDVVELISADGETIIRLRSTCKSCGQSTIASKHDGTLDQWENQHQCKKLVRAT